MNLPSLHISKSDININAGTVAPVFLLLLSAFMAVYYYTNRHKEDISTNYYSGIGFTEDEWDKVSLYTCRFNIAILPLYIPFIFFFPIAVKAILPALIFMLSMIGGVVFYRIKYRKALRLHFDTEKKELEEQKKREESGRWK